jgi:hypothetical protein
MDLLRGIREIEMNVDWKLMVEKFVLGEEQIEVAQLRNNVRLLIGRREIPRVLENSYNDFDQQNRRDSLMRILDYCSKTEYDTRLFPPIIGRRSGPNLWLKGERNKPSPQESWKSIYLLLSSINLNNFLISIDNLNQERRDAWRTQLLSERENQTEFHQRIRNELKIQSKYSNWSPAFVALLVLSYFVYRIRGEMGESEWGGEELRDVLQKEYGFTDHTTLIIFNGLQGREKKEVNYYSKLVSFINRWFGDFIAGKEDRISLLTFLDSVASISTSTKKIKLMSNIREKLVFDLLKFGRINGSLLNNLIDMRLQEDLKAKQFQIAASRGFYKIL